MISNFYTDMLAAMLLDSDSDSDLFPQFIKKQTQLYKNTSNIASQITQRTWVNFALTLPCHGNCFSDPFCFKIFFFAFLHYTCKIIFSSKILFFFSPKICKPFCKVGIPVWDESIWNIGFAYLNLHSTCYNPRKSLLLICWDTALHAYTFLLDNSDKI